MTSRRDLLRVGAAALGGAALTVVPGARKRAVAAASDPYIRLSDYGAVGDGTTNDIVAIQAALDAAPSGSTIIGDEGRTYFVDRTIDPVTLEGLVTLVFPRDDVTFDLNRSTIKAGALLGLIPNAVSGPSGGGVPPVYPGQIFQIKDRTGVRVTNGNITGLPAAVQSLAMTRIRVQDSVRCRIDRIDADCVNCMFVNAAGGAEHVIERNRIHNGGMILVGECDRPVIRYNSIDSSLQNSISVVWRAAGSTTPANDPRPGNGALIEGNVVTNYGRMGIEVYSSVILEEYDYALDLFPLSGAVVRRNRVGPPAPHASGFGLSVVNQGMLIQDNDIVDAREWGIESLCMQNRIIGNRIWWTIPNAFVGIVANGSVDPYATTHNKKAPDNPSDPGTSLLIWTQTGAVIVGNHVHNSQKAIGVTFGGAQENGVVHNAVVAGNLITDPLRTGIDVSAADLPNVEGVVVRANVIRMANNAGKGAVPGRAAIRSGRRASCVSNRVVYTQSSSSGTPELAIQVQGEHGLIFGNTVDAGGRPVGQAIDIRAAGTYPGVVVAGNQVLRGGSLFLSNLSEAIVHDNVGPVASLAAPARAQGAAATGPNSTVAAAGNDSGTITFASGTTSAAGEQVIITLPVAWDEVPLVELVPLNAATAALGIYPTSVTAAGFSVSTAGAPPVSQPAGSFRVAYVLHRGG